MTVGPWGVVPTGNTVLPLVVTPGNTVLHLVTDALFAASAG
jgi:hypothetical protein